MTTLYIPARRRPDFLICAIHAGVEDGTAELAADLHALIPDHAGLFLDVNRRHITSRQYADPLFNSIVGQYGRVISFHGMLDSTVPVYVGGGDAALARRIRVALGEPARRSPPRHLAGIHPENVANRGRNTGIQLELAADYRSPMSPLHDWIVRRIRACLPPPGTP
jgi:phage replication-related protein YjqB (UPF0714/DUF867 family)